jgi:hypothetical protein
MDHQPRVAGVGADAQVLNPTVRRGRPPLGKGEGVLLIEDDGRYRVESLD